MIRMSASSICFSKMYRTFREKTLPGSRPSTRRARSGSSTTLSGAMRNSSPYMHCKGWLDSGPKVRATTHRLGDEDLRLNVRCQLAGCFPEGVESATEAASGDLFSGKALRPKHGGIDQSDTLVIGDQANAQPFGLPTSRSCRDLAVVLPAPRKPPTMTYWTFNTISPFVAGTLPAGGLWSRSGARCNRRRPSTLQRVDRARDKASHGRKDPGQAGWDLGSGWGLRELTDSDAVNIRNRLEAFDPSRWSARPRLSRPGPYRSAILRGPPAFE